MHDGREGSKRKREGNAGGNGSKGLIKKQTYFEDRIELCGSQHVFVGARQITGAVTDAHGTDRLAFSSGKLKYKRALVYSLWLKDCAWFTDIGFGPVGECSTGRGGRDGDHL